MKMSQNDEVLNKSRTLIGGLIGFLFWAFIFKHRSEVRHDEIHVYLFANELTGMQFL